MGNSNVKHIPTSYNRPHSVLGVLGDERYSLTDFDPVSRGGGGGGGFYGVGYNEPHPRKKTPGKALLPPLPRSHSFHQILRPTENGVNLIQKGTIRGIDSGTKNVKEASFPASDVLNPELTTILRERRCRSEANLIEEEEERIGGGNVDYDENNSQDMSEDRSCTPKSGSDRHDGNGRRGTGNGVAARIQRAKNQKGPAPPPPPSFSHDHHSEVHHQHHHNHHNHNSRTGSAQQHHHHHQVDKCMNNVDDDGRGKVCPKRSNEMSISNNKGCNKSLCEKESSKSNSKSRSNSNKVNMNKENDEAFLYKDNFMMIPRLKPKEFDDFNNHFRSPSGREKIAYTEMDNDDLFQSPRVNEPPLTDVNALLIRELARRNREFGKYFPPHSNSQPVSEISIPKSGNKKEKSNNNNKQHSSSNKGIKEPPIETSSYLPPVFDDNFILKRTTPTAGLFKNGKMPENYSGLLRNDDRTGKKFADMSENFVSKPFDSDQLRLSGKFVDKSFNLLSHPWMPKDQQPASIPVDTFHIINPLASSSSLGPESINCKEKKFELLKDDSLGPISSLKHLNHSSISDSANYSDEEEDEIKVVLKPYLPPPPRRVPFEERLIIEDDLFNGDDASAIKYGRQKCWTPMEDLTSSEDDDGINCDQLSDDDEMIGKRDVRDLIQNYNTRFTLRNQLRTLIQNGRPRLSYS